MAYNPKRERARQPFYSGRIESKEPKVGDWIRKHSGFASYKWLEGNIRYRYREWLRDRNKPNHFYLLVREIDGTKPIRVIIKFVYYSKSHVYVYHTHVL